MTPDPDATTAVHADAGSSGGVDAAAGNAPPAGPPSGRRRRVLRVLAAVVAVVFGLVAVLLIAVSALLTWFPGNAVKNAVLSALNAKLAAPTAIDGLHIDLWGGRIEITGIRLPKPPGYRFEQASVARALLRFDPWSAASGELVVHELTIESPAAAVEIVAGTLNFASYFAPLASNEPDDPNEPPWDGRLPIAIRLERATIGPLRFNYADDARTASLSGLTLSLSGRMAALSELAVAVDAAIERAENASNVRFSQPGATPDEALEAVTGLTLSLRAETTNLNTFDAALAVALAPERIVRGTTAPAAPPLSLRLEAGYNVGEGRLKVRRLALEGPAADALVTADVERLPADDRTINAIVHRLALRLDEIGPIVRAFAPDIALSGALAVNDLRVSGTPALLPAVLPRLSGRVTAENLGASLPGLRLDRLNLDLRAAAGADADPRDAVPGVSKARAPWERRSAAGAVAALALTAGRVQAAGWDIRGADVKLAAADDGPRAKLVSADARVRADSAAGPPLRRAVPLNAALRAHGSPTAGNLTIETLTVRAANVVSLRADGETKALADPAGLRFSADVDIPAALRLLPAFKTLGLAGLDGAAPRGTLEVRGNVAWREPASRLMARAGLARRPAALDAALGEPAAGSPGLDPFFLPVRIDAGLRLRDAAFALPGAGIDAFESEFVDVAVVGPPAAAAVTVRANVARLAAGGSAVQNAAATIELKTGERAVGVTAEVRAGEFSSADLRVVDARADLKAPLRLDRPLSLAALSILAREPRRAAVAAVLNAAVGRVEQGRGDARRVIEGITLTFEPSLKAATRRERDTLPLPALLAETTVGFSLAAGVTTYREGSRRANGLEVTGEGTIDAAHRADVRLALGLARLEDAAVLDRPAECSFAQLAVSVDGRRRAVIERLAAGLPSFSAAVSAGGRVDRAQGLLDAVLAPGGAVSPMPAVDLQLSAGIDPAAAAPPAGVFRNGCTPDRAAAPIDPARYAIGFVADRRTAALGGAAGIKATLKSLYGDDGEPDGDVAAEVRLTASDFRYAAREERSDGAAETTLTDLDADVPVRQTLHLPTLLAALKVGAAPPAAGRKTGPFGVVLNDAPLFDSKARQVLYPALREYAGGRGGVAVRGFRIENRVLDARTTIDVPVLDLDMRYEDGLLRVDRLHAGVFGGDIAGSLSVQLNPADLARPRAELALQVTGVNIAYLTADGRARDKITAETEVSGLAGLRVDLADSNIEARADLTKISLAQLDAIFRYLDPAERDATIQANRALFNNWALQKIVRPKVDLVSMWIQYEAVNIDIEVSALPGVRQILQNVVDQFRVRRFDIRPILSQVPVFGRAAEGGP